MTFFDGEKMEVGRDDVFTVQEAVDNLKPYGNYNDEGTYYPCVILSQGKSSVKVRYDEDRIEEKLEYEGLLFKDS